VLTSTTHTLVSHIAMRQPKTGFAVVVLLVNHTVKSDLAVGKASHGRLPDCPTIAQPPDIGPDDIEADKPEGEMTATGSSSTNPTRKPSGSAAWNGTASQIPGFQPSAAAQSRARLISWRVAGRMVGLGFVIGCLQATLCY